MNFYDVLAAEKWGGGIPTINFFDLLFAQFISGKKWEIYEGTLPATINANGADMRQYQIYGKAGGVGEPTGNLFSSTWEQGGINGETGQNEPSSARVRTEGYIEVIPNKIYSLSRSIYNNYINVRFYSPDKSFIDVGSANSIHLIAGSTEGNPMSGGISFCCFEVINTNIKYMRINDQSNNLLTKYMMVEGKYTSKTMPHYKPYGYKLDMSVSDGTNTTITPIYIGDDPLDKDEYIDYEAQKIYRMINGTLTPTDPPVPLPALPTCEGTTIVDYAGQSVAPEKVVFEYAKGGS